MSKVMTLFVDGNIGKNLFKNITKEDYLELVNHESFLCQMAEIHKKNGFLHEMRIVLQEKKRIQVIRICAKAALEQNYRKKKISKKP
ncbi:hypothetical protein [Thalassobacillus sp. C254]|uniref:hypothetical protein n=1 Tax=Thalassobacillus sp. C254 TaxID=1225341 RepID=UPI0006CF8E38|nr:hypothetical protein [Thalassobacillus sp. C254]